MVARQSDWSTLGRNAVLLVCLAVLGVSCASAPPEQDEGLFGLVYNLVADDDKPAREPGRGPDPAVYGEDSVIDMPAADQAAATIPEGSWTDYMPLPYRTSVGDVLRLSFFNRPPETSLADYRVECRDVLGIHVAGQQMFATDVTVRPDGKISFFEIGDVAVRGRTIAEIRTEIGRRFKEVIPSADISVFLKEGNVLVEEFLDTIRSEGEGTSRSLRVRQDGLINFPLIGELYIVGMTLPDLSRALETHYNKLFNNALAVTVNMVTSADGNIAILGEVEQPGIFTVHRPTHPVYALAMAGGALYTADVRRAVLIKRHRDGSITRHRPNLTPQNRTSDPGLMVEPRDILIVPRSTIANVDLWVEQYIRQILPLRFGFGFSYDLND